jgi:tetratricopeptide (TPR) repeat protein
MDKKDLRDLSSGLRTLYNKGVESVKRRNYEYAIEQLKEVVKKVPTFMECRKQLRVSEIKKCSSMGVFAKIMGKIKTSLLIAKIKPMVNKKPIKAMAACEDALAIYLYNQALLTLLADAALNAKAPYIAIEELDFIRGFAPKNEANLRRLALVYKEVGDGTKHLATMQQVSSLHPNDLSIQAELRSAAALASMQSEWSSEEDIAEKRQETSSVDVGDKVIRSEDDIQKAIRQYEQELGVEESIDTRRKLAGMYFRVNRFDDAIKQYKDILAKLDTFDPALDVLIEKAQVAKIDASVNALKEANEADVEANEADIEAKVAELEKKKYAYRLERATQRVNSFPNDTQLRYDLAILYFEGGQFDSSLEQFQYARRNPQRRVSCMMYLGKCFQAKGQYDMATEQLQSAVDEMKVMDKQKMEAMYDLAQIFEASGRQEEAIELFKEIYRVDVNFLDISKRMDAFYNKNK